MNPLPDHAAFARHVGEAFRLHVRPDQVLDVDLVEARAARPAAAAPGRAECSFSLVFRSRGPAALSQRIYHLEHERLGALDLFLVPLGPDGQGMRLEAVFG